MKRKKAQKNRVKTVYRTPVYNVGRQMPASRDGRQAADY